MFPVLAFALSCFAVNEAYLYALDYFDACSERFRALSEARKFYVLKNVLKGYYLAILVVVGALFVFVPLLWHGRYENTSIRILASLYVSNDFVGLWRVEKLATTTRLHHLTSFVFLLLAWQADFQTQRVAQMLLFYCYVSAVSFPVNLYLGLRFCCEEEPVRLKRIARITYSFGCLFNWWLQGTMFENSTEVYCYLGLLTIIVYDDVVLLRWLWR